MDKRFSNYFGLTEEQAIAILETPMDQLEDTSDRYVAASHLINFPTERSIHTLIAAVQNQDSSLDNRIVRRKAVESLGRLQASAALPTIRACLTEDDCYLVENAVWATGEIGTQDQAVLEQMAQLLEKPGQSYRVIIHTLAKLNYQPALERIQKFTQSEDGPIASAAIATICRFTGDYSQMDQVVALLQHPSVNARRGCIQDLIDTRYYAAIPQIARCPVSVVFRLRAIRLLAEAGVPAGDIRFEEIQPYLEQVLRDHPDDLNLVHAYDQQPTLKFLIQELYGTDFGRCYLASKTLLESYSAVAPAALLATYADQAHNDYGAHYHVVKLLGWLKHASAYDLLVAALNNRQPQFQKSRAAAAIALGQLGNQQAVPALKSSLETKIWDLKYAALMALDQLGDSGSRELAVNDADWLVQAKAAHYADVN